MAWEALWEVLAKLINQHSSHFPDPMGAGMESCLDNMRVNIVAFEPMVNPHYIANVSIFFLGGYGGFPSMPGWESRFSFPDCPQELPAICSTVLQELFGARCKFYFVAGGQVRSDKGVAIGPGMESRRFDLV